MYYTFKNPKTYISEKDITWDMIEKEALAIRENFTEKQIQKLQTSKVDGDSPSSCIYGLMVGNCNSKRVIKFIDDNVDILVNSFSKKEYDNINIDVEDRSYSHFITPLELYIMPEEDEYILDESGYDTGEFIDAYYEKVATVIDLIKYGKAQSV